MGLTWTNEGIRPTTLSRFRAAHGSLPIFRGSMDLADHYANAVRAEPGICWRMVSRGPGYRLGIPTDCPEPVRSAVGQWSGESGFGCGHVSAKRIRRTAWSERCRVCWCR
jgi:hypothetical protein